MNGPEYVLAVLVDIAFHLPVYLCIAYLAYRRGRRVMVGELLQKATDEAENATKAPPASSEEEPAGPIA